jgi:hypothetical protein
MEAHWVAVSRYSYFGDNRLERVYGIYVNVYFCLWHNSKTQYVTYIYSYQHAMEAYRVEVSRFPHFLDNQLEKV